MLVRFVAEDLRQDTKLLESFIDRLMKCSNKLHHLLKAVVTLVWRHCMASTVSSVGYVSFTIFETILQAFFFCNLPIWVCTTWKWAIRPNNVTIANIESYFIPYARALELVREPFRVKRFRFVDVEISSIHRY